MDPIPHRTLLAITELEQGLKNKTNSKLACGDSNNTFFLEENFPLSQYIFPQKKTHWFESDEDNQTQIRFLESQMLFF